MIIVYSMCNKNMQTKVYLHFKLKSFLGLFDHVCGEDISVAILVTKCRKLQTIILQKIAGH